MIAVATAQLTRAAPSGNPQIIAAKHCDQHAA